MTVFIFNRRTTEDQTIYVEAESVDEAWRKARDGDCFDASDIRNVVATIRRLPAEERELRAHPPKEAKP